VAALFVLRPARLSAAALLADASSSLQAASARLRHREHPAADDADALVYHLRTVRDPVALRWRARAAGILASACVLGAAGAAASAVGLGTHGGDLAAALRDGLLGGALLSIATLTARQDELTPELVALLPSFRPGDALLWWAGRDHETLRALQRHCQARGLAAALRP
jgi:hypothetical protein